MSNVPGTDGLGTDDPSSVGPSSVVPSSVGPSSVGPSSVGPSSVGLIRVGPSSVGLSSEHLGMDVLSSEGLLLRPWQLDDADVLIAAYGNPDVRHYSAVLIDTAADATRYVALRATASDEGTALSWAVTRADTGTVLGHVSVTVVQRKLDCAMIGYWLLPRARGRGVATRAVRLATAYAFGRLDLHRIELSHGVENLASCGVAERAGYPYEGTHRDAMRYPDGRWSTEHLHARLVTDP